MNPKLVLLIVAMFAFAGPAMAADAAGSTALITLTPAFSMAMASGICALAQGRAVAAAAEGMARNPGAFASIRFALILGLALIESLALYTLVIVFLK